MKECEARQVYGQRLINSCQLLRSLDSGNYPLSHYSAGEKSVKRVFDVKRNETRTTETIVDIPIWPEGPVRGLRYGVTKAIFSDLEELTRLGIGKEARDYVKEMKR